jgi:[glutamine synthetase] adenylyltransferase / [glutamine synthetase]-adenylyl-L-tyrosine phosphorylase
MIEDRQTHSLPEDGAALDAVAALHGLADGRALLELLGPHVAAVGALYDDLDGPAREGAPRAGKALETMLRDTGFRDAAHVGARIADWRSGRMRAVRSGTATAALEAVLPSLLAAFGQAPDPDAAVGAFDAMLAGLPTALNLFRLLEAQPTLLKLLVDIISHAPALADALARDAALLDRLLDASAFEPVGDVPALVAEMTLAGADTEAQLDHVRRIVGEHRFALGTQIVRAAADPLDAASGYARVAEAAVQVVTEAVLKPFVEAHGRVPESGLVIIALGRLGGCLLTHASDLDLIYLFTGDFASESDGPRPLGGSHYYNRLGQRLSGGLSAPTASGALYEVDTRLRPSGGDGPLVCALDSFALYQRSSAWTWEHMAMTRARVIYGSADARTAVATVLTDVLGQGRAAGPLARDVVTMRREIAVHKPPLGPLDVKLATGGLVDLEFVVHFHQLATGQGLDPHLPTAIAALVAAGRVEPALGAAHDLLTRLIVTLRLVAPAMTFPAEATQAIVARACGADHWNDLLARVEEARQCVRHHWQQIERQVIDRPEGE